jgi:hypothetical protein
MTDPIGMFGGIVGVSIAPMIASTLNGITAESGSLIMNSLYAKEFQWNQIIVNIIVVTAPAAAVLLPGIKTFLTKFIKSGLTKISQKMFSATGKSILPRIGKQIIGPGIAKLADDSLYIFETNSGTIFGTTKRNLKGGNSTVLREELETLYGLQRETLTNMNVQAHHIIPKNFKNHPLLEKIDFNIDSAINGIPLLNTSHNGSHPNYNNAFRDVLDKIYDNVYLKTKDIEKCREYILEAITNANNKILDGTSLHKTTDQILKEEWLQAIMPSIL